MRSLLAVVLFIYIADCQQFRSDYNFHPDINGWLKLQQIPATFQNAWLRCRLEGAVLASPSNSIIESAMLKKMWNRPETTGRIITGIHATFSKGDFISIEGIPLNNMQLRWMSNEPDNKNNDEECIIYTANNTIADVKCSDVHPYICHKKYSPNMKVTECGTIDKEYKLDTRTGKCYKVHTVARNWTRAFMTCSAEEGHLAVINSETEANVIKEMLEKYPSKSIKNIHQASLTDIIFIGFHDWNEKGVLNTIHGTSLVEAGYEIWLSGEPNNNGGVEHCGSMFRNGKLNDDNCDSLLNFVCEKSPESLQNYKKN